MSKNIACCGLDCFSCPAFKATAANDDNMRRKTAEEWSKAFQITFKPEDINCKGCKSDLLSGYCKTCEIRVCNMEHSFDNCTTCDAYSCEKLERFLRHAPEARKNLEELKIK